MSIRLQKARPLILLSVLAFGLLWPSIATAQVDDPTPPGEPVKLIFIHHSTGENWLTDGYGNLGQTLAENNYFVSDTNYGWGPDSIGDRTDIPNWTEWFRSDQTTTYTDALFNESEQHSNYTRTFDNPGGENSIILFKSCFPNSALEGHPDDPPDPEGWLSVGHAKYIYNEILQYFATRPDKLFIIITAPPLQDDTHAGNARAFNNWLLNDWLDDNGYAQNNVAVFDFYNVLTGSNAHHRYANDQIEHIIAGSDTLAYPSGDDHPSEVGSRKATEEFVPLLNIFYHRWQSGISQQSHAIDATSEPPPPTATFLPNPGSIAPSDIKPISANEIDNFEESCRMSSSGWQAYWDEATTTRIICAPTSEVANNGTRALEIDFDVAANSWATCELSFDESQNWANVEGVTFNLHAGQTGLVFNVDVHAGSPGNVGTYAYTIETPPDSATGWIPISLRWEDFQRVEWEENAGQPLSDPQSITGMAFGFDTPADAANTGKIWVDDLYLSNEITQKESAEKSTLEATSQATATQATGEPAATPSPTGSNRGLPCGSSLVVPLAAMGFTLGARRRVPHR